MKPKGLIELIRYNIDTCEVSIPEDLMKNASLHSRAFVEIASGRSSKGFYSLGQLYENRWCEDEKLVLDYFEYNLNDDERIEVLIFYTHYLHELTHHTDILITPFGVNYQSKLLREYLNLQSFAKLILPKGEILKDWVRIIDLDISKSMEESVENKKVFNEWENLKGQLFYFDALFDFNNWGKRSSVLGWNNNTKEVPLFKYSYNKITVRNFFQTIQISESGDYLTPIAILECRAIINCIRWIYWNFNDESRSKKAILIYLKEIYSEVGANYRFILDSIASLHDKENFESFIQTHPITYVDQILLGLTGCCWYALNSPPPMNEYSLHNSNPIIRLIISLREFGKCVINGTAFNHIAEFLDFIDQTERAQSLFFKPISNNLNYCIQFNEFLLNLNSRENENEVLKNHFEKILLIQKKMIEKRFLSKYPYSSNIGLAENGNPIYGIEDEEIDWLLLENKVDKSVGEWFSDRSKLLFKITSKDEMISILSKNFPNRT